MQFLFFKHMLLVFKGRRVFVHVHTCMCLCVRASLCVPLHAYVCLCVCVHASLCTHVCASPKVEAVTWAGCVHLTLPVRAETATALTVVLSVSGHTCFRNPQQQNILRLEN